MLLMGSRSEVLAHQGELAPALLDGLADSSDQVVLQALDVQASLAREDPHFRLFMVRPTHIPGVGSERNPSQERLLHHFCLTPMLLETRGSLIVRRLCVLLGAERVYREMASILMEENSAQFVGVMIQALNLILLTSMETADLRKALKASLSNRNGAAFFTALFPSWCHSAVAAISLCLLAQAYGPASRVVASLGDVDTTVDLLVQVRPSKMLLLVAFNTLGGRSTSWCSFSKRLASPSSACSFSSPLSTRSCSSHYLGCCCFCRRAQPSTHSARGWPASRSWLLCNHTTRRKRRQCSMEQTSWRRSARCKLAAGLTDGTHRCNAYSVVSVLVLSVEL